MSRRAREPCPPGCGRLCRLATIGTFSKHFVSGRPVTLHDRPFRVGSCSLVLQGFVADAGQPNRLRYGSSPTFIVGNHAAGHTDSLGGLIQTEPVSLHPYGEVLTRGQACLLATQVVQLVCSQVQPARPTQAESNSPVSMAKDTRDPSRNWMWTCGRGCGSRPLMRTRQSSTGGYVVIGSG